jgi:hypothetical protein
MFKHGAEEHSQYSVCSDDRTNDIYFDQAIVLDKVLLNLMQLQEPFSWRMA